MRQKSNVVNVNAKQNEFGKIYRIQKLQAFQTKIVKTIKFDVQFLVSQTYFAFSLTSSSEYNKPIFADTSIFIEINNLSQKFFCFAIDLILNNTFRKIMTPQNANFEQLRQHLNVQRTMFNHKMSNIYFDYLRFTIKLTD